MKFMTKYLRDSLGKLMQKYYIQPKIVELDDILENMQRYCQYQPDLYCEDFGWI
jgi:hypothetical protein